MKEIHIVIGDWSTMSTRVGYRVYEDIEMLSLLEFLRGHYTLKEVLEYLKYSLLDFKEMSYASFEEMLSNIEDDEEDDFIFNEDRIIDENGFVEVFNDVNDAREKHYELSSYYQNALFRIGL